MLQRQVLKELLLRDAPELSEAPQLCVHVCEEWCPWEVAYPHECEVRVEAFRGLV